MSTQDEQKLKQEGYWMTILVVIPAISLSCFSDLFFTGGFAEIAMSGVLGGVGALIGAMTYYFTKDKSTPFRILTLVMMILSLISITAFLA